MFFWFLPEIHYLMKLLRKSLEVSKMKKPVRSSSFSVQKRAHRWRYERRRPPSSLPDIFSINISKIIKKSQFKAKQLAEALVTIFVNIKVSRTK